MFLRKEKQETALINQDNSQEASCSSANSSQSNSNPHINRKSRQSSRATKRQRSSSKLPTPCLNNDNANVGSSDVPSTSANSSNLASPKSKRRRLSATCNKLPKSNDVEKVSRACTIDTSAGNNPDDENSLASSISAYDLSASNQQVVGSNATKPPANNASDQSEVFDADDPETPVSDPNDCNGNQRHVVHSAHQSSNSPKKRRRMYDSSLNNLVKDVEEPTEFDSYTNSSCVANSADDVSTLGRYPLRSRIRLEVLRQQRTELNNMPKDFNHLSPEIYSRILQYLPIQDICRVMRVNRRFYDNVITYLTFVKRINFSSGLPFAYLPRSMDDRALKRLLQRTPQVTHILGFYPRKIYDGSTLAQAPDVDVNHVLTYLGIMAAFRSCSKLRSVEIMDVELMSRVVHGLPRVKFHGMFRNRPDNWDEEYACASFAFSRNTLPSSSSTTTTARSDVWSNDTASNNLTTINNAFIFNTLVNPIPRYHDRLVLPTMIHNLTKLDLVSVCISAMPRLENIKYLHLKWVRFSSADPFQHFVTPKLQSFVMNNCVGPTRALRYIRIFTSLARATQLSRLEIVATRFVEGLLEHVVEDGAMGNGGRSFKTLQRLVMAGNRDCGEGDIGFLLLAAQQSLVHVALQFSHSRDSLFLALMNAGVSFTKMDTLILGYQDPFQSRLTQSEIISLDLLECFEPLCLLTDQGLSAAFRTCPRLSSLHIRNAPYLERPINWDPAYWDKPGDEAGHKISLRTLTLENCKGIQVNNVEELVNGNNMMPFMDTLVLRDMFPILPRNSYPDEINSYIDQIFVKPPFNTPLRPQRCCFNVDLDADPEDRDPPNVAPPVENSTTISIDPTSQMMWQNIAQALRIVDRLGGPIGLGPPPPHHLVGQPPRGREIFRPHDINAAVRTFRYRMQLYQLNGRLGHAENKSNHSTAVPETTSHPQRRSSRRRSYSSNKGNGTSAQKEKKYNVGDVDFDSRGCQTCICGLLEWQPTCAFKGTASYASKKPNSNPGTPLPKNEGVGWKPGPSATHHRLFFASQEPCVICSPSESIHEISNDRPEPNLSHKPRTWIARDACVDTHGLIVHLPPELNPIRLNHALQLTTLHLEKVGVTQILIGSGGAPRLKNLTLENCPELQSVVLQTSDSQAPGQLLPALRRLRVVRCPKIAIYHLLYTMSSLYPQHDDNLYITYRPFGDYNSLVEKILWQNSKHCHILISHDYQQKSSERQMEEMRSSFDQLFREVLNFSETLIRKEILTVHETPDTNTFSNCNFMRSEYGKDWDLTTDIPWISEICCSMLPNDLSRSEQADQLYEHLAEIQCCQQIKLRRRGILYHVQMRDLHKENYLPQPYTDEYLTDLHPLDDINAFYVNKQFDRPRPPRPKFSIPQSRILKLDDDCDDDDMSDIEQNDRQTVPKPPVDLSTSLSNDERKSEVKSFFSELTPTNNKTPSVVTRTKYKGTQFTNSCIPGSSCLNNPYVTTSTRALLRNKSTISRIDAGSSASSSGCGSSTSCNCSPYNIRCDGDEEINQQVNDDVLMDDQNDKDDAMSDASDDGNEADDLIPEQMDIL